MSEQKELLTYFIEQTEKRFDKLEEKLDNLNNWKMKVVGGAIVVSFLVSTVMAIFFH